MDGSLTPKRHRGRLYLRRINGPLLHVLTFLLLFPGVTVFLGALLRTLVRVCLLVVLLQDLLVEPDLAVGVQLTPLFISSFTVYQTFLP